MRTTDTDINMSIAIVVIAYNRLASIQRLIKSLLAAEYFGDSIDLIISIDNSGSATIVDYARSIVWPHGHIKIIEQEVRLGLKAHVLKCGSLTSEYDHLCVFEDDLYASPGFYRFAKNASLHFSGMEKIAGISLYTHEWNQYVNRPFVPMRDGHDVFLLQVASSWGQVWSRKSWSAFETWMAGKKDEDLPSHLLPKEVSNWSPKSWLKFHNKYLAETNQFFVYPRESLSTNFSDAGEHAIENSIYQVSLLEKPKKIYCFPSSANDCVQYDSFFENMGYSKCLGISADQLDVNLYGNRSSKKRYLLSTLRLKYKAVASFGLKMRPIDLNIIHGIEGNGIYLYDTSMLSGGSRRKEFGLNKLLYDVRFNAKKELLIAAMILYINAILRKIGIIS